MEYKDICVTVPSLRLDAIISSCWNLSRQYSQKLIKSDKVKVNWEPIDKASKEVSKGGDLISTRGYGRFILYSIDGISRKGRIKL